MDHVCIENTERVILILRMTFFTYKLLIKWVSLSSTAEGKMLISTNLLTFQEQMSNVEKKRDRRTDK